MPLKLAADWLGTKGPVAVMAALQAGGHQAWYVGGCVRNALMGRGDSDIDIATTARPDETTAAAQAAGLKAVPTGAEHGTITVVADHTGYEVTTLRRDVETDGRHAVVHFADRIEDDAARRDFTMNALYALPDGTVVDPLGGMSDLQARRVRFIGEADQRIAEDYLRILRFFRFTAWYADPAEGPDAEGLAACAAGLDGLDRLAAERVGAEMRKLLSAPDPAPAVAAMAQTGVLARLLPGTDPKALAPLVHFEQETATEPDPIRRLLALGGTDPSQVLRLTRAESRLWDQIHREIGNADTLPALANAEGYDHAMSVALLRAAMLEQPPMPDLKDILAAAAQATFPVTAQDLIPAYQGKALGDRLRHLKQVWIASSFQMTKDALLAEPD